ncbi:MAG: ribonuclease Z, partial [Clostridiales bacterium]|nr:ribonuclease Z [Clostridiales bacterium]
AFLQKAGQGEFCFVEDQHLRLFINRIETLYLFKWNRAYPADFYFDIDLSDPRWKLIKTEEFSGKSHQIITLEEYTNEKI